MHPGRESCAKNTTRATCARVAASACPNPSRVVAIIGTVAGLAVVGSHPNLQKNNTKSMFFLSTWRSSRPRRKMCGRSGTRRTPHAKGQNVALALAPRTCFLKVLLPLKRGAHFSLTNSSGAWGSSAASWGLLRIPGAFLGPPGTFCGLLGPPRAFAGMGRGAHPARRGKMSLSLLRRAHVF